MNPVLPREALEAAFRNPDQFTKKRFRATNDVRLLEVGSYRFILKEFTGFASLAWVYYAMRGYIPSAQSASSRCSQERIKLTIAQQKELNLTPRIYDVRDLAIAEEYIEGESARYSPSREICIEALGDLRKLHNADILHGDPHIKNYIVGNGKNVWVDFECDTSRPGYHKDRDLVCLLRSIRNCAPYCPLPALSDFVNAYSPSYENSAANSIANLARKVVLPELF